MMDENQERAWQNLTSIEQSVLILNLTEGKSLREVGAILKIPHYKCLQIRKRSENLFKVFLNHYSEYGSIFNPLCPVKDYMRDFYEGLIEYRESISQASIRSGNSRLLIPTFREIDLKRSMKALSESEDLWDISTHNLILEFDRFNMFRILPKPLQRISPYKRKNTRETKASLIKLTSMSDVTLDYIISLIGKTRKGDNLIYITLFSYERWEYGYKVIPINFKNKNLDQIRSQGHYIWEDIEDADYYGALLSNYFYRERSSSKGQNFWRDYREHIQYSINYREVNKLNNSKFNLEDILRDKRVNPEKKHNNTNKIKFIQKSLLY